MYALFPYREEDEVTGGAARRVVRPTLDVQLDAGGALDFSVSALIDTGASSTLFPRGAAEALGFDMTTWREQRTRRFSIGGADRFAVAYDVHLTLLAHPSFNWDAEAWFFVEEWPLPFGILGGNGFLDRWAVSFVRRANYFVVESAPEFEQRVPVEHRVRQPEYLDDEWDRPTPY